MKALLKKILLILICFIIFLFFINHFVYSSNSNNKNEYLELFMINSQKIFFEKEDIFLNLDPLSIVVISNKNFPKASFCLENSSKNSIFIFQKEIKEGLNIYPLDFLLNPDIYTIKLIIDENKTYEKKFFVKNSFLRYQIFYPLKIQFYYPNWLSLDPETIEKIYQNLFLNEFKIIGEGLKVILVVKDYNNAQFAVFSRQIKNKEFDFQDYIKNLSNLEKKALNDFNFITDYKIIEENIENNEVNFKIETLSNGINYLIISKTLLKENFLGQKFLITFNFTFPKKDILYYQNFIDFIFESVSF